METLDDEKERNASNDQTMSPTKSSKLITELIEEILSRLPVEPLLRFRSVSKPWFSLISDPSFVKLHYNRTINHRLSVGGAALFIFAFNTSTYEQHLLSGSYDGGTVTHLITLPILPISTGSRDYFFTYAQNHIGLVLLTTGNADRESVILFNPSTRKILELPSPADKGKEHFLYMSGFDASGNEYKILNIRLQHGNGPIRPGVVTAIQFLIFTLSTRSWKKVNLELPTKIKMQDFYMHETNSVCVDGIIYSIFGWMSELVLVFDLMKEAFSIMKLPVEAVPSKPITNYANNEGGHEMKTNDPALMKMNGLLAVVCHDRVVESNEMDIWILEDYKNQVWVKETISFPSPWIVDSPFPLDTMLHTGEIIFTPRRLSRDVLCSLIYDMKKRSFRSVEFTVDPEMLGSRTVAFQLVRSYVESMIPL